MYEPMSNEHIQAGVAADNSKLGASDDVKMAETDAEGEGEGDSGEANQSPPHTRCDDEYFEVEAIKSCKLGSRVRHFSVFLIFILTIVFFF
jgi:hypothetical protein